MGISIHYRGGMDRTEDIPKLVEELADIAEAMDWQYQAINEDEAEPDFFGIIVNPKGECEPLCFIFDRRGRLRNLADLITNQIEASQYSEYCATKTQFTTPDTHIWIIGLLRYLKQHYMSDLIVSDEAEYWETGNRATLIKKREILQGKMDAMAGELAASADELSSASLDDVVARIERIAKKL